jgi:phosphatidate cytidylyltransferase
MDNFWFPYLLIMAHFLSGAFWLMLITRKAKSQLRMEQWKKYIVYLLLFNLIWHSIVWFEFMFPILGYVIIVAGILEWGKAIKGDKNKLWLALGFILILVGFWRFLYMDKTKILFTFFVVVLFDGASQISGQLIGKKPLLPQISPQKTIEGLVGGVIITLVTSLLVQLNFAYSLVEVILTTSLIMIAAFCGDLLASIIKREAGLGHFSNILPGHGGILDRYDSLILAGCVMYIFSLI